MESDFDSLVNFDFSWRSTYPSCSPNSNLKHFPFVCFLFIARKVSIPRLFGCLVNFFFFFWGSGRPWFLRDTWNQVTNSGEYSHQEVQPFHSVRSISYMTLSHSSTPTHRWLISGVIISVHFVFYIFLFLILKNISCFSLTKDYFITNIWKKWEEAT